MTIDTKFSGDPISVDLWGDSEVRLRIGGTGQGEGRYAVMTAHQAKLVAYALLFEAEKAGGGAEQA